MHKDKRKKRLARKQRRIAKNRQWWVDLMENNKEWLNQPMPEMLARDYYREENKVTFHSASFVDIAPQFIINA